MLTVVFLQVTFFLSILFITFSSSISCYRVTTLSPLFVIVLSGNTCRPHPYRKRPTLGNVSNQHMHHSIQHSYNLGYQDSYSPEYPSLHLVTTRFSPFDLRTYIVLYYLLHCCCSSWFPTAGLPGCVMRFVLMPSG